MMKKHIRRCVLMLTAVLLVLSPILPFVPPLTASAIDVVEPELKTVDKSQWPDNIPKDSQYYVGITGLSDYIYYDTWVVKVNNVSTGRMAFLRSPSRPELGLTFAHQSTVSAWGDAFNGNPTFVASQLASKQTSIKNMETTKLIDRAYSRDVARWSGAKEPVVIDEGVATDELGYRKSHLAVTTTPFPDAALSAASSVNQGTPYTIKVSGKEYSPYENVGTWKVYSDTTLIKEGVFDDQYSSKRSDTPFSTSGSYTFNSCGSKTLKLVVTDEVQRSTTKSIPLTVNCPVEDPKLSDPVLEINPPLEEIYTGESAYYTATYTDEYGDTTTVTSATGAAWSVANSTIASASATKGQFVGKSRGETSVTVAYKGLTANARLIVNTEGSPPPPPPPPPTSKSLTIEPTSRTIFVGEYATYKAYYTENGTKKDITTESGASWSIANSSIGEKNTPGWFIGKTAGSTSVSVAYNGLTASAQLHVESKDGPAPDPETEPEPVPAGCPKFELTPAEQTIDVGAIAEYTAYFSDSCSGIAKKEVSDGAFWQLDDPTLAKDEGRDASFNPIPGKMGTYKGLKSGETTVTASYQTPSDGKNYTATAKLIVNEPPPEPVDPDSLPTWSLDSGSVDKPSITYESINDVPATITYNAKVNGTLKNAQNLPLSSFYGNKEAYQYSLTDFYGQYNANKYSRKTSMGSSYFKIPSGDMGSTSPASGPFAFSQTITFDTQYLKEGENLGFLSIGLGMTNADGNFYFNRTPNSGKYYTNTGAPYFSPDHFRDRITSRNYRSLYSPGNISERYDITEDSNNWITNAPYHNLISYSAKNQMTACNDGYEVVNGAESSYKCTDYVKWDDGTIVELSNATYNIMAIPFSIFIKSETDEPDPGTAPDPVDPPVNGCPPPPTMIGGELRYEYEIDLAVMRIEGKTVEANANTATPVDVFRKDFSANREQVKQEIQADIDKTEADIVRLEGELATLQSELSTLESDLAVANEGTEVEECSEPDAEGNVTCTTTTEYDEALIASLESQIAAKEVEIEEKECEIATEKVRLAGYEKEMADLKELETKYEVIATKTDLSFGGQAKGSQPVSLKEGELKKLTFTWILPANGTVKAEINPAHLPEEVTYANNTKETAIYISSYDNVAACAAPGNASTIKGIVRTIQYTDDAGTNRQEILEETLTSRLYVDGKHQKRRAGYGFHYVVTSEYSNEDATSPATGPQNSYSYMPSLTNYLPYTMQTFRGKNGLSLRGYRPELQGTSTNAYPQSNTLREVKSWELPNVWLEEYSGNAFDSPTPSHDKHNSQETMLPGGRKWYLEMYQPDGDYVFTASSNRAGVNKLTTCVTGKILVDGTYIGEPDGNDDFLFRSVDPSEPFPGGTGWNWVGNGSLLSSLQDWWTKWEYTDPETVPAGYHEEKIELERSDIKMIRQYNESHPLKDMEAGEDIHTLFGF